MAVLLDRLSVAVDGLACEADATGKVTEVAALGGGSVAAAAALVGGAVNVDAEEDEVLGSSSAGSSETDEGSPVLRFFGPRRLESEVAV